jgi:Bax protein
VLAVVGAAAIAAAVLAMRVSPAPANVELPDMTQFAASAERKAAFFGFLEPIVISKNARILSDRASLREMAVALDAGRSLSSRQLDLLESLAEKYALDDGDADPAQQVRQLLLRADAVPLPLVMVQAAKESGWGTSRFAREANNLFGQWCFEPGCGIVPERRPAGARHEVRDFDSVEDAVTAYLHNINTGRAYQRLREIRAQLRRAGEKPSAIALADGLLFYSERREEYVNEVKRMILQYHKFQQTRET